MVRAILGKDKWALYLKNPLQKIATFRSEFEAYDARRAILKFENHNS